MSLLTNNTKIDDEIYFYRIFSLVFLLIPMYNNNLHEIYLVLGNISNLEVT